MTRSWPRRTKRRTTSINTTFIYVLNDPRTNQIRYVGKADDPLKRWKQHCKPDPGCPYKSHWVDELRELGMKPELEILEEVPYDQRQEIEREYVRVFRMIGIRLTNIASGGEGFGSGSDNPMFGKTGEEHPAFGYKHSDEAKKKISDSHTGDKNINFGKPRPAEENQKRSVSLRGLKIQRKLAASTSAFLGVTWRTRDKCWESRINVDGVRVCLGYYESEIDAAIVRDYAANIYFGVKAKFNFPEKGGAACLL